MSDWGWVALGYGLVYGVVATYAALLVRRVRMARRALKRAPEASAGAS